MPAITRVGSPHAATDSVGLGIQCILVIDPEAGCRRDPNYIVHGHRALAAIPRWLELRSLPELGAPLLRVTLVGNGSYGSVKLGQLYAEGLVVGFCPIAEETESDGLAEQQ